MSARLHPSECRRGEMQMSAGRLLRMSLVLWPLDAVRYGGIYCGDVAVCVSVSFSMVVCLSR